MMPMPIFITKMIGPNMADGSWPAFVLQARFSTQSVVGFQVLKSGFLITYFGNGLFLIIAFPHVSSSSTTLLAFIAGSSFPPYVAS